MNNCSTCKHWAHKGPRGDAHQSQRQCKADAEDEHSATVANGEPFNSGALYTGPYYACPHYTPRLSPRLIPIPKGASKHPIEPRDAWAWMLGGDGLVLWANQTHYHPDVPVMGEAPAWATHIVYFGK